MSYAELHCLSNFSFLRGASHPQELVQRAKELGYDALAITDECSMAGIVRAHEQAKKLGFKLIIGSEFHLGDDRLVLLAPDHDAYTQLCELITRARRGAVKGEYKITPTDFEDGVEGCLGIWIPEKPPTGAGAFWFRHLPLSGHWLGFGHHLEADSEQRLEQITALGRQLNLPLVATGDVHYHARSRRQLQDVLTATRLGCKVSGLGHRAFANGERHLRPLSTLQRLYPPELLQETWRIAERCNFSLDELRYEYPHELVPAGETPTEHLRKLTLAGLEKRYPQGVPAAVSRQVEQELVLIAELRYEHYFLTVADAVRYARSQNILCQGRGSAANSAVCYALGITEVDPGRIGMLFERFISRERAEPPDIDVDFEHQRREEVIQYIYNKYGRDRAALAATVICYRPRSAIRDVGKALGLPPEQVDLLAKSLYWFDGADELAARLRELGLSLAAPLVRQLFTLVTTLIGFPRHLSQHVGGFVISERPLSTLVPVENAAMPERSIIQWDKEDLEALGLLKVDCLALGMLSAIRHALDMIARRDGRPFRMQDIPAEDPATYEMLCRGDSTGVFQVESRAQMSMLPRLQPKNYYDLVIQVAIVRPGPIQGGMVHPYLQRRAHPEAVEYPSEALKKVLEKTLGVPIFQEQVMQIAIVAAGFSPGEADQVRRSMAAWQRRGGLEHFRDKLMRGMAERGYKPEFAEQIYQQVLGFGSYGFPESHSASFALLVYASAWLKCHEPAAFCAGLLNAQPMGFYAPAQLTADVRRHGVTILAPDVNISDWDCTLESPGAQAGQPLSDTQRQPSMALDGDILSPTVLQRPPGLCPQVVRLGLRMISSLPEIEAQRILVARAEATFTDVEDLAHRARLTRRALNALAEAGALANLAGHRHRARWSALGVERLPGFLAGHSAREQNPDLRVPTEGEEIVADYRGLSLTLGRHPLALLRDKLSREHILRATDLVAVPNGRQVRVAGLVTHRQRPETASGVLFVSLEDETGVSNLIVWPGVQARQRRPILESRLMVVSGELQKAEGVIHVIAERVWDYSRWLGALHVESRDFR